MHIAYLVSHIEDATVKIVNSLSRILNDNPLLFLFVCWFRLGIFSLDLKEKTLKFLTLKCKIDKCL